MILKLSNHIIALLSGRKVVFAAVILLLSFFQHATGQIIELPIPAPAYQPQKVKKSARTKADEPLKIPFWDDFSFTQLDINNDTLAGFPLDSLWEDSYSVWISNGVGLNAPSVNVASFDGLDSAGTPYSAEPLAVGMRDVMTSRPIDLSSFGVPVVERPTVFFSFFYQWKGNGEPPDDGDYLRVEFRNDNDEWITVATIATADNLTENVFYDTSIQVGGDEFFHENFQFRFRNFGRLSGRFDNWNIDYVYLDKGRSAEQRAYPDGAFASSLGPYFDKFYSVPIEHFFYSPSFGRVKVDVQNLRGDLGEPDPYAYRLTGDFTNYSGGTPTTTSLLLTPVDRPVKEGNPLLQPFERTTTESLRIDNPDPSVITPGSDSARIKLHFLLLSNDNFNFTSNDTISNLYRLKDYYAYDDGSAEYSVGLYEPGDRIAYRFKLPDGFGDQLTGMDIYIPPHTISGFTTGDFVVMNEDGGLPGQIISSISQVVKKTKRDSLQRILLTNPVDITGTFFIGWRGSFSSSIYVGLDKQNDTGDEIFVDAYGQWQQNVSVRGSIMIRPVFGTPGPITGIETKDSKFGIYPNPSRGSFFINGIPEEVSISTASGQSVSFDQSVEEDRVSIILGSGAPGVYVVKIRKGSVIETKKVVVH